MPSILSDDDKQTVKRTVPKGSNKIHAVAVAKLYIAYPDRHRWTYTGLQGAAVLANDLVGNTFWIKLVDISPLNRGVIWDQEIYDTFQYNQDRTFFHTFELEQCLAGLSFADEKEAKQFKKKMDEREKNAHKNTKNKPFGMAAGTSNGPSTNGGGHSHGLLGSITGSLFGHKHSSHQPQESHSIIPPKPSDSPATSSPNQSSRSSAIDTADPSWQPLLKELLAMGITEDQIEENADFIKMYIEQKKANEATANEQKSRAPPPPPPGAPPGNRLSPQNTGSTTASRRGPPPAPPPARRKGGAPTARPTSPSPARDPSPPPQPRFKAPPPIADAGKFANQAPLPPARARASSNTANPGPPPPPRKTEEDSGHSGAPPPPPPPPPPGPAGAPPAPPPPPPGGAPAAPKMPMPAGGGGRDDLLASIRGGAKLKKVSDSEKKDRSAAMVPGASSSPPPASSGGGAAGAGADGGLAGALASALAARKSKVSHSDDEDDDDW
ncbi:EVH1 domain-containing protein [Macrophomina phaseolina MS6]|uniref:EVH1 domain-containing protein n=1 Tax=Macrophomina phaseolina (strain MS6) TaxID=1126212 RepID=K2RZE3_MACPH|nr:EVH1 domain-containing protein [Macrophomina phaseolina MS6]